jgi:serine/threonine-protein kinase RsbW
MSEVELHLPPDVAYVGLARLVVVTAARQAGMSEDRVEDLRIAVSEATANAVIAHRRSDPTQPVVLSFGVTDDGAFGVRVDDTGPGVVPQELGPDRGSSIEGGLGVSLIRELADRVDFVRGEGTRVHMRFSLALSQDRHAQSGEPAAGSR